MGLLIEVKIGVVSTMEVHIIIYLMPLTTKAGLLVFSKGDTGQQ